MKALKIILMLFLIFLVVEASRLSVDVTRISPGRAYYVSKLVKDWNRKNLDRVNDVVIFNYGNTSDLFVEVHRSIPDENPLQTPHINHCDILTRGRKAAFIIIIITKTDHYKVSLVFT